MGIQAVPEPGAKSCCRQDMAQARPWTSCFTTMRPDVVVFSFASDAVSDEDKTALAVALLVEEATADDDARWAEAQG